MLNPILNKKILEAIIATDKGMPPVGTPPFNPNAGPPQIGPPLPHKPAPVGFEDILGIGAGYKPTAIPGPSIWPGNMSPDMPATPSVPWSGYETAGKRQELNIAGLRDEYGKLQESVKKPRAKAKLKTSFSNKDLPIALIGGLMSYLAGGKNPSQSVDQFVQAFAGFNKQRADEENQAEMQRVEEENRAAELEIASQKIGIDLKKLEYDEQEKVLERFRKEEDTKKVQDWWKEQLTLETGAKKEIEAAKTAGAVAKGEAARLQDRLLTLDDKELGSRGIAYLKLAMADGVLDVSDMDYISKTFLNSDTVNEANKRGVTALNAVKTRTAEQMLPLITRAAELGIALKERDIQEFDAKFPYMAETAKNKLLLLKAGIQDVWSRIADRDIDNKLAERRFQKGDIGEAVTLYRGIMTGSQQSASEYRSQLQTEQETLDKAKFNANKAMEELKLTTNPAERKILEDQISRYGAEVAKGEAAVNAIKENIAGHQKDYSSAVESLKKLESVMNAGNQGGGGGEPGKFTPYVSKQFEKLKAEGWGRPEQFGPGSIEKSPHKTGEGLDIREGNGKTLEQAFERMKKTDFNYLIFRGREYKRDAKGAWKDVGAYTGPNPHNDHVHGDYNGRPPYVAPKPNSPKNPNLSKVAAGLGMGAIGGLVGPAKKKETKPATKKTRTVKIGDKTITVDEN